MIDSSLRRDDRRNRIPPPVPPRRRSKPFGARLRAALPGANDGLRSVASLLVGVAAALLSPALPVTTALVAASIAGLALLGAISAATEGARMLPVVARLLFWAALAMAATATIGTLLGAGSG